MNLTQPDFSLNKNCYETNLEKLSGYVDIITQPDQVVNESVTYVLPGRTVNDLPNSLLYEFFCCYSLCFRTFFDNELKVLFSREELDMLPFSHCLEKSVLNSTLQKRTPEDLGSFKKIEATLPGLPLFTVIWAQVRKDADSFFLSKNFFEALRDFIIIESGLVFLKRTKEIESFERVVTFFNRNLNFLFEALAIREKFVNDYHYLQNHKMEKFQQELALYILLLDSYCWEIFNNLVIVATDYSETFQLWKQETK